MAVLKPGQVANKVTIKRNGEERQADSVFTITEKLEGSNDATQILMSFGTKPNDQAATLASIKHHNTKGYFLQLSSKVIEALPDDVQEIIAPLPGQDGVIAIQENGAPISIDPASGDVKTTIKSKDGNAEYTVTISAGGIKVEYDGNRAVYAAASNEVIHTSMSQKMFQDCLMEPEKTIAQIKGLEIDRAKRIDATKIPMFMLSAYITSVDKNNDGHFHEAFQEIKLPVKGEQNSISIAILSQPTTTGRVNSQYLLKTHAAQEQYGDESQQHDEVRLIDSSSFTSTLITSVHLLNDSPTDGTEEENSTLVDPKIAFNMSGSKKARLVELPMDKQSHSVDRKIVGAISRLAEFVGKARFPEPPADVKKVSLNAEMGDEQLYSTRKDELRAQKLSNKNLHTGAKLVTELDDIESTPTEGPPRERELPTPPTIEPVEPTPPTPPDTEIPTPPPPPPSAPPAPRAAREPAETTKTRTTPFIQTALKEIARDKNFKLKPEWGQAALVIGVAILLLSALLGPIGIVIGGVLGATIAVGGLAFAINAESMNNPYIKMEKFLIDPLLKQEREFENEQAQFWETEEELHKANEAYDEMVTAMQAEGNPDMAAWHQFFRNELVPIFDSEELQNLFAEDSLEFRQAFISDLVPYHELLKEIAQKRAAGIDASALEAQAEEMKRDITIRQFGSEAFGKTTPELDEFGRKLDEFANSETFDNAIVAMRKLNEVQERKESLKEEMADQLLEGSDRLLEKVLASNALPNDEKIEFVRENANVIARRLCYQTQTDIGLEELLSSLPSEAIQEINTAVSELNHSRSDFEVEIQQKHERDLDSKTLNGLVSTLENVMQDEALGTAIITDKQLSERVEGLYQAQAAQKVKDHTAALNALSEMTEDDSTHHDVADKLAAALDESTINAIKNEYTARDTLLKNSGFYNDIGRELLSTESQVTKATVISTSLRDQMELRLREAFKAQRETEGSTEDEILSEMSGKSISELLQPPFAFADAKNQSLHQAYNHDLHAESLIANELHFTDIANVINTDPEGSNYVETPTLAQVQEVVNKHKALKAYPYTEQEAIVKICLALKQKDANISANITDDATYVAEWEKDSLERKALDMILSGEFKLALQDRCITETYASAPSMHYAKDALNWAIEGRQKIIKQIVTPNATNAKVQKMLQQVVTEAGSYSEIRRGIKNALSEDAAKEAGEQQLTTNENVPLATIINPNGTPITTATIEAAKTRIREHDITSQSIIDEERKRVTHTLGHEETQEIYNEVKNTLKKGKELEDLSSLTAAPRDKHSEKIDNMASNYQLIEQPYAVDIATKFANAMSEPLDDGGVHRIAKIQEVLNEMQQQIDAGKGRRASAEAKTMRKLALKYKFEMPQVTEEGFNWLNYMQQVSKHIEDTTQAEFDRVYEAKNASKTSEQKSKKKTVKRKKLKKNALRLQRALEVAFGNATEREEARVAAAETAVEEASSAAETIASSESTTDEEAGA